MLVILSFILFLSLLTIFHMEYVIHLILTRHHIIVNALLFMHFALFICGKR